MGRILLMTIALLGFVSCNEKNKALISEKTLTVEQELSSNIKEKQRYDSYIQVYDSIANYESLTRKRYQLIRNDESKKDSIELYRKWALECYYKKKELKMSFLKENRGTVSGAYALLMNFENDTNLALSEVETIELFNSFKFKNSEIISQLEKNNNLLRSLQPGQVASNILLPNPNGIDINLSDLKGKYVLVDFWASWCYGCRQENPNLKRIYKDFKGKGLEILGVSFDKKNKQWLKAIDEDKTKWLHVCDSTGMRGELAKAYNLKFIPQFYLIDKEGVIVQKGLRGQKLYDAVKKVIQ
jgi:peroxiredoxin